VVEILLPARPARERKHLEAVAQRDLFANPGEDLVRVDRHS